MSHSSSSYQSSGRRHASSGSNTSSSNNPFKSQVRDNLPSFAECFQGFHKYNNIGEHNIVAASPQQWAAQQGRHSHLSSPPFSPHNYPNPHTSRGGMSASQLRAQPMPSPIQLTPQGREKRRSQLPDSKPHTADFSFRTLELESDDEDASDAPGTPPRQIEREDESDEAIPSSHGDGATGGSQRESGTPQQQRKPPLHPNVSPFASSPIRNTSPLQRSPREDFISPGKRRAQGQGSPPYRSGDVDRPVQAQSTARRDDPPHRRAMTLEELAVKQLYPLFGEFLRTLPPQRLEELLLYDGHYDTHGGQDVRRGGSNMSTSDRTRTLAELKEQHRATMMSSPSFLKSVEQQVNEIIPPLHSLESEWSRMTYCRRDFAYYQPALWD